MPRVRQEREAAAVSTSMKPAITASDTRRMRVLVLWAWEWLCSWLWKDMMFPLMSEGQAAFLTVGFSGVFAKKMLGLVV